MISITVNYDGPNIVGCTISGHANAAKKGEDLVCAGVSAIAVGTLNALVSECEDTIVESMDEGFVDIQVHDVQSNQQMILKTMMIQLETIQAAHPNYVKILKQEV